MHPVADGDVLTLLAPIALVGLLALAGPIVVHILARRRAQRIPFPTLRFIRPGQLASVRRHVLEDVALLALRMAILACAALAFAAPLVVTQSRLAAWNAELRTTVVEGADLHRALHRAVWSLNSAPPGRQEIVVRSAFPIGSITREDVMGVPDGIGLRFERTGTLPAARTVDLPAVLTESGVRARTMTVDRATNVREGDARPAASAAPGAVLSERVLAPIDGRRMRLVTAGAADLESVIASATPVRDAWMADGIAAIARDRDVRAASKVETAALTDARMTRSPWIVAAKTGDGRPLAVAGSAAGALTVVTAEPASSLVAALLARAASNALGPRRPEADAEVLSIPDAQLAAWTQAPLPMPAPRPNTIDRDDRRWLWIAALALLALESWVRGRRREARRSAAGAEARVA